jgi:hypothetical protein
VGELFLHVKCWITIKRIPTLLVNCINLQEVMRFLISLALLMGPLLGHGQTLQVIAREGLRLHAAPSQTSEVVAVVPFGAEVIGEANLGEQEKVEGLTGFWVPVFFDGTAGYAFSAHLLPAIPAISEWELKGSKDCIVLPLSRPHTQFEPQLRQNTFQANFYHGDYFWYGLQFGDGAVVVEPIEVVVSHYTYTPERVGDMPEDYRESAFFYEVLGSTIYDQLMVSKQMMPNGPIASKSCRISVVEHPYPEDSHGVPVVFESDDQRYNLESVLSLDGHHLEVKLLIDELPVDTLYQGYGQTFLHVMRIGDLNGDGLLDFLLKEESLADCCGCHAYYRYAYSRRTEGGLYYDFTNDFW